MALRRAELAAPYLTAETAGDHPAAGLAATTAMERSAAAGEWWPADIWGHRALWHFERAGMELEATRAARLIGDLRTDAGDPLSARRYYAEAISEARDLGAEREQGLAALGMGRAAMDLSDVTHGPAAGPDGGGAARTGRGATERDRGGPRAAWRGEGGLMTARREARRDMRVAIVGAGVMAEAMIAGLLADKAVPASRLVASHPRRDRRDLLAARHGITVVTRNAEAVTGADIVVLAVKPQMLGSVMREVGPALEKGQVVLSIVAGATLRTLTTGLGTRRRGPRHAEHTRRRSGVGSRCGPRHRPAPPGSASSPDRYCAPSAPRRRSATRRSWPWPPPCREPVRPTCSR